LRKAESPGASDEPKLVDVALIEFAIDPEKSKQFMENFGKKEFSEAQMNMIHEFCCGEGKPLTPPHTPNLQNGQYFPNPQGWRRQP